MHNDDAQVRDRASEAPGKRLLMEAALRLTSTSRSLSSLGLRELAREMVLADLEVMRNAPIAKDA